MTTACELLETIESSNPSPAQVVLLISSSQAAFSVSISSIDPLVKECAKIVKERQSLTTHTLKAAYRTIIGSIDVKERLLQSLINEQMSLRDSKVTIREHEAELRQLPCQRELVKLYFKNAMIENGIGDMYNDLWIS